MERKYINEYIRLLLEGCLKVNKKIPLFINYNKVNQEFALKVKRYAENLGLTDIYLDEVDSDLIHDTLLSSSLNELKKNKLFDCSHWNLYAKKKGAFLMLNGEIPHLMDDIPSDKVAYASTLKLSSKPLYREYQEKGIIPWCIAVMPNEIWAKELFKDEKEPLHKFWLVVAKLCMLKGDSILNWQQYLKEQNKIKNKLNKLNITKLYYQNSLGTNLELELPKKALWQTSSDNGNIVNMPSYEIFTTPHYKKTNGIVYSSRPLIYNGVEINDFYIKFKNGKAVESKANKGNDILQKILESAKNMTYLGECALVNYNSPISKTNICFKTTLLDENASCHLALGAGFPECYENGLKKDTKELYKLGINESQNHVDFMIGTKDLLIEADTNKGRITIMKDGNIVI